MTPPGLGRRTVLLGGGMTLAGCTTPSMIDCVPGRLGTVEEFRCRASGRSEDRVHEVEGRLSAAADRYRDAQARNEAVRGELAQIEREVEDARATVARLRVEQERLLARLAQAGGRQALARSDLEAFHRLLEEDLRLQREALLVQPPAHLRRPVSPPAPPSIEAQRRDLVTQLENHKAEVRVDLGPREDDELTIRRLLSRFVGEQLIGAGGKRVLQAVLIRVGLRAVNPALGVMLTLKDLWDLGVLLRTLYPLVYGDRR